MLGRQAARKKDDDIIDDNKQLVAKKDNSGDVENTVHHEDAFDIE